MAISLNKGGNLSLSKTDPSLNQVLIGLGWDARATDGADFDLDASAFLLAANDKVRGETDFIFYNQTRSPEGSVEHTGDNRTGDGDGDDETITVDLQRLPATVTSLVFTVNSFTGQNFEKIANAYCRIPNASNKTELARLNLSEKGRHTGVVMASLVRGNGGWDFKAIGQVTNGRTADDLVNLAVQAVRA